MRGPFEDDEADPLAASLAMHDDQIARRGLEIWIGVEPTFTRPDSLEPPWVGAPEGDDKRARAAALAAALAALTPGAQVSHVVGRQLAGVTPDPGVIEVNLAPAASALALSVQARRVWSAAARAGLSPVRYRDNGEIGEIGDPGGGGQLSIGGASPTASPFVRYPHVLPALVRYVNNHPSLSYWFASECTGSASRGPRPDEGTRERYDELGVALGYVETLADRGELPPELLWSALAPLLVDPAGNSHRAELNIERLWNPYIAAHGPRHGKMGIVELRAVRMPERPGMLVALAALLRSIVARLAVAEYRVPLADWHDDLHDRFALPSALVRDLRLVLGDLDEHQLGIPPALRRELEAWRPTGIACRMGDAMLTIRPALEFWPLVGDVGSQERAASRTVDASTARVEIAVEGSGPDRVAVDGRWAHLRAIGDGVRAIGIRRRVFEPSPGFHPGMPARDPLVIEWSWEGRAQRIELWSCNRTGDAHDGAPHDAETALARRNDRIAITTRDGDGDACGHWIEVRPFTIDLRRLGA